MLPSECPCARVRKACLYVCRRLLPRIQSCTCAHVPMRELADTSVNCVHVFTHACRYVCVCELYSVHVWYSRKIHFTVHKIDTFIQSAQIQLLAYNCVTYVEESMKASSFSTLKTTAIDMFDWMIAIPVPSDVAMM